MTTLRPQWAWELAARSGRVLDHPLSPVFTTRFDAEEWLGLHWRTLRDQGAHIALLRHDGASVPPAHTLASIPDAVTYPAHS